MSNEIKNAQKEAAQMAKELGIYNAIRNIATNGRNTNEPCAVEWENCEVIFNQKITDYPEQESALLASFTSVLSAFDKVLEMVVTKITMPNGTVLYRSEGSIAGEQRVTDFRYGAWVERMKLYSEKVTLEYQEKIESDARNERIRANEEREKQLKPFSQIDF